MSLLSYQSCVADGKPTSLIRGSNPIYSDERHHTASALATEKVDVDGKSSHGHSEEEWPLSPSERRALVSVLCCVSPDAACMTYPSFIHAHI
jgi:hypothetical protein